MYSRIFIILFLIVLFVSCGRNSNDSVTVNKPGKGEMEELNRYLLEKDRERIMNFAERKELQMTETPTGLWYQIIKQGEGAYLKEGNRITMDYECSLLDGTKCYSSDESGPKEVVLGKTGIETGLYEGLKLLRPGSVAIFIIPPFLAYGLPGDGKRIPPRSVIVYKVNILRAE
ncbi:MAG TPA: FKBP-type peptidyl-prolyl cis-trans isomerase [Bacteroidales bacterium]|nr:FKBP-type peptidyl-prolyl cis-trans isomerase [Bacteroidales bacterium]